jgi:hypothetical protein
VQTQFVLDAMAAEEQKMEKHLEKMHESINLICSKLQAHDAAQQQIATQMNLTTQAITQSLDEQLKMAQQLAAMSEMLARLTTDQ